MKKILLFLSFLLISIGVWGTPTEYVFTSKSWAAKPANWSGSKDGNQFNTSAIPKGVQVCEGQSGVTVTSPKSFINVTKVEVTYSSSGKAVGTIGIKIGTNIALTSQSVSKSQTEVVLTFTPPSSQSGTIVMTCNVSKNSYGINKIKITESGSETSYSVIYESNGGSEIIDPNSPYISGSKVTIQSGGTKNGYTFDSWNTKSDLTGIEYINGDTFIITDATTLYAKWLKDTSIISNNCNILSETFDYCDKTGGNDGIWNGISGDGVDLSSDGWTYIKGVRGNKCGRFGSGTYAGSCKTPALSTAKTNLILTFRAGAWNGGTENTTISLSAENANLSESEIELVKGEWTTYKIYISNITNDFTITWSGSGGNNRFFLDDICISETDNELMPIIWYNDSVILPKPYFDSIDFDLNNVRITDKLGKTILEPVNNEYLIETDFSDKYCSEVEFIFSDGKYALKEEISVPYIVESNEVNIDTIDNDDKCDIVIHNKLNVNTNKEKRDVIIYPQGILNILENDTFTVNSLTLRRDNDSVPYLSHKGTLDIKNRMFFEMRTDGSAWRWLTLPDTFRINTVDANNETDYSGLALVKYYNGNIRVNNGRGGWKLAPADTLFCPGNGITFGAYIPESDTEKRIYKIELDTNILSQEKSVKKVLVYPYGKGTNKPANDLGWNVVGNPFMEKCNISSSNPIRIGTLVKSDTNPWDGKWVVDSISTKVNYIIVKDTSETYADAGYYKSIPLNIDGHSLEPFTSFFIQVDTALSNPSVLTFTKGPGISYAPSKEHLNPNPFIRINVGNKQLGVFISDGYTDKYEIGEDLESLDNTIYLLINGYKLLYSAINDSILEAGIYIHSNSGIVSLEEKTTIDLFEEINILSNGEWSNLLNNAEINASGDFILQAKRKLNDISTNIENVNNKSYLYKVIRDGNLFIYKNGIIYDIFGRRK